MILSVGYFFLNFSVLFYTLPRRLRQSLNIEQCHRQTDTQTDRRTDDIMMTIADHTAWYAISKKAINLHLDLWTPSNWTTENYCINPSRTGSCYCLLRPMMMMMMIGQLSLLPSVGW